MPYFLTSYAFIVSHFVYYTSGNLLVPIWLAYLVSLPQFWRRGRLQESNLDAHTEQAYSKDQRFMWPLHLFVFCDTLNWLWCLCVVSGTNPFAGTTIGCFFENRHGHGLGNAMVFVFVWGYMSGLCGLAGHELIHKRDAFNKSIGTLTFTKMLYSHFLLEHSSGHHRNVATPDDPATAVQGETFY